MKKNYLLLFIAVLTYTSIFSQVNRKTLYIPNYNLMNPSIIKCSNNTGYMISGSAVIEENNSTAFLFKVDNKGNTLWKQLYRLNSSSDTRSYGMAENANNGTVLLTGYYDDGGQRLPYVLELSASNGSIVNSVNLDICDNIASASCSGYGLDIIVDSQGAVLVAGFGDDGPLNSSSTKVHGYVFKLDPSLNQIWFKGIESNIPPCSGPCTNCPTNRQYPMVGRIVEMPGQGYFITGSLGDYQSYFSADGITQVSLAAQLTYNGFLDWQSPFSLFNDCSTGNDDFHVGVDAYAVSGGVLMASNFSNSHGFAVSYLDASQGNRLSDIYYGPTDHYWAYSIRPSLLNQSGIIVAGIKHRPGTGNDVLFVANVEKGSHIIFWAYEYDITIDPSYYESFGNTDDRLVPFRGVYAPFINYPEMIASTDKGYLMVCNRVDGPGLPMAIDLVEIDLYGNPTDQTAACTETPIPLTANLFTPFGKKLSATGPLPNNSPSVNPSIGATPLAVARCNEPLRPIRPRSDSSLEEETSESQTSAFPNPARPGTTIEITLPDQAIKIELYNLMGQKITTIIPNKQAGRIKLDSRQLEVGTYIYTVKTPTALLSNRIVIIK